MRLRRNCLVLPARLYHSVPHTGIFHAAAPQRVVCFGVSISCVREMRTAGASIRSSTTRLLPVSNRHRCVELKPMCSGTPLPGFPFIGACTYPAHEYLATIVAKIPRPFAATRLCGCAAAGCVFWCWCFLCPWHLLPLPATSAGLGFFSRLATYSRDFLCVWRWCR